MKQIKLVLQSVVWCFLSVFCFIGEASSAQNNEDDPYYIPDFAYDYAYYIKNYDVLLTVDTNRMVSVQEDITIKLNNYEKNAIAYRIPKKHGHVSDVRIFAPYTENHSLGMWQFDLDATVPENSFIPLNYRISYNNQIFSNENTFDYQIIKPEWDVPMHHVRFKLQLPDTVKTKDVHLFIDRQEIKDAGDGVEFFVKGDYVIGQITADYLGPKQSLRIRVDVPNGFFVNNGKDYAPYVWVGLLLLTLISFLLWYIYGQDDHLPTIISQDPPKGVNAAEAEIIYGGSLTEKGLIAQIISLANDGYINIDTVGKNFTLTKVKNYVGKNVFVKEIMKMLFADAEKIESSEMKASDKFYNKWQEICDMAEQPQISKQFDKKSSSQFWRRVAMLGCLIGNVLLTMFVLHNYMINEEYLLSAAVVVVLSVIGLWLFTKNMGLISKIIGGIFLLYVAWLIWIGRSGEIQKEDILQVMVGIACILISAVCYIQMPKPNALGRIYKGQLFGLKNFIKFADNDRLEKLMNTNSDYFYKVLPYAYVMGMHSDWLKQYDGIDIPAPAWFASDNFKLKNFVKNFAAGVSSALETSSISDEAKEEE